MGMELGEKEASGWGNRKAEYDSEETGMARIVSVVFSSPLPYCWTCRPQNNL